MMLPRIITPATRLLTAPGVLIADGVIGETARYPRVMTATTMNSPANVRANMTELLFGGYGAA